MHILIYIISPILQGPLPAPVEHRRRHHRRFLVVQPVIRPFDLDPGEVRRESLQPGGGFGQKGGVLRSPNQQMRAGDAQTVDREFWQVA